MLTRLRVSGFKNLVDVGFGPFTCIAGANGVGKSNLFDAIRDAEREPFDVRRAEILRALGEAARHEQSLPAMPYQLKEQRFERASGSRLSALFSHALWV